MQYKFTKVETDIEGAYVLTHKAFFDERGSFSEIYNKEDYKLCGITEDFVQDNLSISEKGVLRGVHTQLMYPQGKIVLCLYGRIFDVTVDCRPDSSTYKNWFGVELSAENHKQVYIPAGVAHGFYSIERATVFMKVSTHYTPGDEIGFKWDDESIGIEWPFGSNSEPILAEKDKNWGNFNEMMKLLEKFRI